MATQDLKPSFSNLQLELLKLYANGISDEQLLEIKWLLGKYFAEKAAAGMDKFIEERDLTQQEIIERSKAHHRRANRS
jgi:hypothetical protein